MYKRMRLICCDVLFRMACRAAAQSRNVIDMDFTKLQSHNEPDKLRSEIQGLIDKADAEGIYDAILLGYGLCGNSVAGLAARRQPLVIPRAHDCCTLFLGSRSKFEEHFGERLSSQWSSHGYLERSREYLGGTDIGKNLGYDRDYAALVEQYGEENAEYIWETLHPTHHIGKDKRIYIDVSPFDSRKSGDFHYKRFVKAVEAEAEQTKAQDGGAIAGGGGGGESGGGGGAIAGGGGDGESAARRSASGGAAQSGSPGAPAQVEICRLEGSTRLIDMLINGDWGGDFLVVQPGMSIMPVYDMERVMTSGKK